MDVPGSTATVLELSKLPEETYEYVIHTNTGNLGYIIAIYTDILKCSGPPAMRPTV